MHTFANYQRHSAKECHVRIQNPVEWTLGSQKTQLMMPRRSTRDYFDLAGIRQMLFAMTNHLFDPLVFEWPSEGTGLSDVAAYIAIKLLPGSERSWRYPGDFDSNGNLRTTRVPLASPCKYTRMGVTISRFIEGTTYSVAKQGWVLTENAHGGTTRQTGRAIHKGCFQEQGTR